MNPPADCWRHGIRIPPHHASKNDLHPGTFIRMTTPWCCLDLAKCQRCPANSLIKNAPVAELGAGPITQPQAGDLLTPKNPPWSAFFQS